MQKTKLINRVIAGAMLSFALATQGGQAVQAEAQRPTFFLRAKCVDSGLGNVRQKTLDVSIGKAVYTSRFYLGSGNRAASITCKIRQVDSQPLFQTLQLGFGMRDNNTTSPPVVVNVYLDGQQAESRTIAPTQQESLSLDVSKATNVTLEAVCSSQSIYCERVYFFNAALEPLILAPSPSK
jgi:hypothetical protein